MANILSDLLRQVAIYWPVGGLTESGRRDYSSVTAVEVPCYWSNEVASFTDVIGRRLDYNCKIITSYEIQQEGVLWLTTAKVTDPAGTGLAQIPSSIPMHQKVRYVERYFSLDANEVMFKGYM